MSDDYNKIRACLEQHLRAIIGIPLVIVGNVKYDPQKDTPFVRAQFAPLSRRPANVGPNPLNRHDGLYSLNVYTPEYNGEGEGLRVAQLIADAFAPSTSIAYGGENVGISYSEVMMAYGDSPFFATPVNVGWYAYT